ncbi:MAG: hypothetical protein KJ058_13745 [Thermoanaerobaculia bacterium]|nr:hypothetical protein [Thermoanaerobaculia bacterium]
MMATHPIIQELTRVGATQADLARHLGVNRSTVHNKLSGRRRWVVADVNRVMAFLRERGSEATYEQLFAPEQNAA